MSFKMEAVSYNRLSQEKVLLCEAVKHNDIRLITEMLSMATNGQESGGGKENILDILLAEAIDMRRPHFVHLLLSNGANSKGGYKGKTHFSRAVLSGDADIVQSLLNSGGDIAARGPSGKSALHEAAAHSGGDIVRLLTRLGADVEARDGLQGNTPLHVACTYCNRGAIRALFDEGASVNALNDHRETPLAKVLGVVKRKVDFHDRSRIELGKELILLGFQILPRHHVPHSSPPRQHVPHSSPPRHHVPHSSPPRHHVPHSSPPRQHVPHSSPPRQHVPHSSPPSTAGNSRHMTENSTGVLHKDSSNNKGIRSTKSDNVYSLYMNLLKDVTKSLTLQGLCRLTIVTCLSHSPLQVSVGRLRLPVILQQYIVHGDKET